MKKKVLLLSLILCLIFVGSMKLANAGVRDVYLPSGVGYNFPEGLNIFEGNTNPTSCEDIYDKKTKNPLMGWFIPYNLPNKGLCVMDRASQWLIMNSEGKPMVEADKDGCCVIKAGKWLLFEPFSNNEVPVKIAYEIDEVDMFAILPMEYIIYQVGCDRSFVYRDMMLNIIHTTKKFMKKYVGKLCVNKAHCRAQYDICMTMETLTGDNLRCQECFDIERGKFACKDVKWKL